MQANPTPTLSKDDYVAALENLTKAHEAVIAERKKLEDRVEHLVKSVRTLAEQRDQQATTIDALREKIANYIDALAEARREPLQKEEVYCLAQARKFLKGGRFEDGRYEVERVLDSVDSSWRTL